MKSKHHSKQQDLFFYCTPYNRVFALNPEMEKKNGFFPIDPKEDHLKLGAVEG